MDKLRAQIHTLTLQLEDERGRNATVRFFTVTGSCTKEYFRKRLFLKYIIAMDVTEFGCSPFECKGGDKAG